MQLKNLKIRTGLLIGFCAVLLLLIILGSISFMQTERMWQDTDHLYKHPFTVNIAVREIQTKIMAIHRSIKDIIISKTPMEIDKNLNKINMNEAEISKLFDTIYERYLGKKQDVDNASNAFKEWALFYHETIRLRQKDKGIELIDRTTVEGEEYVETAIKKINILRDYALNRAIDFHQSAQKNKNILHIQFSIVLIAVMLLLILIFFIMQAAINNPMKNLIMAVDKQRNGEYSARSSIISANEFGLLAAAFNNMAESIESEIFFKNSVNAISNAMFGKEKLDFLVKDLLNTIMHITNSNICAIYFLNEETSVYEHYHSIGLSKNKIKFFSADTNEGEFGLALAEKKIQKITRIPDDTVFIFSTVAGNFKPKEIITIPVLQQDKVIALISISAFHEYSEKTLQILEASMKDLSLGINNILAFEKIRKYSEQLDTQYKELEAQSKELKLQSDEMHKKNAELEIQKRHISEANRLKSEFLASMSHELRTPLNSVIALSGVLNKKLHNQIPEKEYGYLEIIERNGKHLLTLINNILNLSRIEAGKEILQYSKVSIQDVVNSNIDNLQIKAQEKGINLSSSISSELPLIISDNSKLYHILQNIIANAVKFTDNGSVDISAEFVNNEVHLSVIDTGIGIADDQLPHIFEEFRQIDGSDSRRHEGAGLGLAIVDKYCRMLNIKIEMKSKPGEGSTFKLIIPAEPKKKQLTESQQLNNVHGNTFDFPPVIATTEKTILIIECNEPQIIQLSGFLKEQKYNVIIAKNGIKSLNEVKKKIYDAIIIDWMMPGINGLEILEKVRSDKGTSGLPVLILTAKYLTKDELRLLNANNIYQLILKGGISKNQLLESVNKMFVS